MSDQNNSETFQEWLANQDNNDMAENASIEWDKKMDNYNNPSDTTPRREYVVLPNNNTPPDDNNVVKILAMVDNLVGDLFNAIYEMSPGDEIKLGSYAYIICQPDGETVLYLACVPGTDDFGRQSWFPFTDFTKSELRRAYA